MVIPSTCIMPIQVPDTEKAYQKSAKKYVIHMSKKYKALRKVTDSYYSSKIRKKKTGLKEARKGFFVDVVFAKR